jgi:serine protease Do
MKRVILPLFLALISGFAGAWMFNRLAIPQYDLSQFQANAGSKLSGRLVNFNDAPVELTNFEVAAEMTVHSVVHIKTYARQEQFFNDPWHQFFFGDSYRRNPNLASGTGSGVIVSEDGYIVTNNHVIANAEKIEVTLNNKKSYQAEVIGTDPTTDLALIKIEERNLPFVTYANSDEVKVGQWVLAVGNPFNLTSTVTAGIVSAKGRNINILEGDPSKGMYPIESFIQTDAAVNPGNSGGALVNTKGQLVGINAAIASNTGSYAGYSFAIPVNIVKKVSTDLLEFGTVQRAFIGVSIRDIDNKLAEEKKIKQFKGVFVSGITDGGAASDAGIKEGDIILKVGGEEINSSPELQEQVGKYRPGEKVLVTVARGKEIIEIPVTLRNRNGTTALFKKEKERELENSSVMSFLGARFEPVSTEEKQKLRIQNGLKITKLERGRLSGSGIKEGFIITSIDKKPVSSISDLEFLEKKRGGVLIEGVYPNGFRAYYGFGL